MKKKNLNFLKPNSKLVTPKQEQPIWCRKKIIKFIFMLKIAKS